MGCEGEENWVGGGLRSTPSSWALTARKAGVVASRYAQGEPVMVVNYERQVKIISVWQEGKGDSASETHFLFLCRSSSACIQVRKIHARGYG